MIKREQQYKRKINYIIEKITNLPDASNEFMVDALFYRIHTSIEAAIDLIAMMVKDIGYTVEDDISNIEILIEKKLILPEIGTNLRLYNSLRNILVHRYNKLELEEFNKKIPEIRKTLLKLVGVVENFTKKNR